MFYLVFKVLPCIFSLILHNRVVGKVVLFDNVSFTDENSGLWEAG